MITIINYHALLEIELYLTNIILFANHQPLLAYLKALGGKILPWDANSEPCFEEALLSLSLIIIIIELYLSKSTIERDILSM